MYVLPSVYAEGLSVFFDITTEDKMASGEGIIGMLNYVISILKLQEPVD